MSGPASRPGADTIGAFIGVAVLGGVNAIAVKQAVTVMDPFWSAGVRFLAAGVLLAGFVAVSGRSFPHGRSLFGAVLYGALGFAASYALLYAALRDVPAGTAMVFLALVPLETFGLAVLQRQERFHAQGLVGALVALAGVVIVVVDQLGAAVPLGPMLLILLGTLFIAQSGIVLKSIPRSDPFATNGVAMLAGSAILMPLSLLSGEAWAIPSQPETWTAMAYLVLLGSIALFGLYLFALRRWTASAVSYVTLLMPLVTVPLAALLFGEEISLSFLVGGAVAIVGVYVGAFLRIRPRRTSSPSLPECLPVDACAEPEPTPAAPAASRP